MRPYLLDKYDCCLYSQTLYWQVITSILTNPLPLTGSELASIFVTIHKACLSENDVPLGHLEALAERSIRNGCLLGIEPASLTSLALSHAKVASPSSVTSVVDEWNPSD